MSQNLSFSEKTNFSSLITFLIYNKYYIYLVRHNSLQRTEIYSFSTNRHFISSFALFLSYFDNVMNLFFFNYHRSFIGKVSTGLVSMIRVLGALPIIRSLFCLSNSLYFSLLSISLSLIFFLSLSLYISPLFFFFIFLPHFLPLSFSLSISLIFLLYLLHSRSLALSHTHDHSLSFSHSVCLCLSIVDFLSHYLSINICLSSLAHPVSPTLSLPFLSLSTHCLSLILSLFS